MNIPLLCRLRAVQGAYVPLLELGEDGAGIQADFEELQAFGFGLERHPYLGLAYRGPAERLCPDQIEFDLGTRRVGRRIAVWDRVTSTNDLAAKAAGSVANDGLVVLAEEQTAGRGRRGRRGVAPPRSCLLMSVLLFPPDGLNDVPWLTALGAVAVAEVVTAWTGRQARIKWPNDVRVGGRKVAGILVERGHGAVVGIGINANVTPDQLPDELRLTATSLCELVGAPVDRSELARALIRQLDDWYDRGRDQGPATLSPAWSAASEHLGQLVRVVTPDGSTAGRLDGLDLQHGLLLTLADGTARTVPVRAVLELSPIEPESAGGV